VGLLRRSSSLTRAYLRRLVRADRVTPQALAHCTTHSTYRGTCRAWNSVCALDVSEGSQSHVSAAQLAACLDSSQGLPGRREMMGSLRQRTAGLGSACLVAQEAVGAAKPKVRGGGKHRFPAAQRGSQGAGCPHRSRGVGAGRR